MKTDTLFYELFKQEPQSLFELLQIKAKTTYEFESITLKSTEKRLDGFFKPKGPGPIVFAEVQDYDDPKIYWRLFWEICAHYTQNNETRPFIAIVLFLDKKHDPGNFPIEKLKAPCQFIKAYLGSCLKQLKRPSGILTPLQPLIFPKRKNLVEAVKVWKQQIKQLKRPIHQEEILIELLECAILERFPKLTIEEIRTMLELTPLDQTVAGKQLIAIGHNQGEEKGLEKGQIIGEIRMAQRVLKQDTLDRETLMSKSLRSLKTMLKQLEKQL